MKLVALTLLAIFCSALAWEEHDDRINLRCQTKDSEDSEDIRFDHNQEHYEEEEQPESDRYTVYEEFNDNEEVVVPDSRLQEEKQTDTTHCSKSIHKDETKKPYCFKSQKKQCDETDEHYEERPENTECDIPKSSKKEEGSCKRQSTPFDSEIQAAIQDKLKAKIIRMALEKEMDSLLTLITLDGQIKVDSQILEEQEEKSRKHQLSDKQSKEQNKSQPRLKEKQKKKEHLVKESDKVEKTFIIKSKSQKVKDFLRDDEETNYKSCDKKQCQPQSESKQKCTEEESKKSHQYKQQKGKSHVRERVDEELKKSQYSKKQNVDSRERIVSNKDERQEKESRNQVRDSSPQVSDHRQSCGQKNKAIPSDKRENLVKVKEVVIENVKRR